MGCGGSVMTGQRHPSVTTLDVATVPERSPGTGGGWGASTSSAASKPASPAQIPQPDQRASGTAEGSQGNQRAERVTVHPKDLWNTDLFERHFNEIKQQAKLRAEQAGVKIDEGREIHPEEIDLGEKIGEGQFARVYKATCRGKQVAVKVLSVDKCDESFIEDFIREVEAMSKVNHPNVCLYMGACTSVPGKMMIVTPLYSTSLDKLLFSQMNMSLAIRVRIARDVAMGMNWLHCMTPKLIHSDLKTNNILLDESYHAVVCDFGQTQILHGWTKDLVCWGGTPLYMAPEKLQGLSHNEKVDVYSYGLVLWEIVHRQRAYDNYAHSTSLPAFIAAICERHERPLIRDCPASLASLIEACWQASADLRPSFQRVVENLEEIVMECTIPDQLGLKFWTENFGKETHVTWKVFKSRFGPFVNRSSLFWIKPLVAERPEHKTSTAATAAEATATTPQMAPVAVPSVDQNGPSADQGPMPPGAELIVTMEQFGTMLTYFGPLGNFGSNVVDRAMTTLMSDWFHGEVDSNEAAKLLRADGRVGAFMVRFSGREPGTFTLSRITGSKESKEITHQRIRNQPPNGLAYAGTYFNSLPDLIIKVSKQCGLKFVVAGSKFSPLIERWNAKLKKQKISGFRDGGEGNYAPSEAGTPAPTSPTATPMGAQPASGTGKSPSYYQLPRAGSSSNVTRVGSAAPKKL